MCTDIKQYSLLHILRCLVTDIDECSLGTADCDSNAGCKNTVGSYLCTCNAGYKGDGKSCQGIDMQLFTKPL